MPKHTIRKSRRHLVVTIGCAIAVTLVAVSSVPAQLFDNNNNNGLRVNNVGGVFIDAEGMLLDVQRKVREDLRQHREQLAVDVPDDMASATPLRKISLSALRDALRKSRAGDASQILPQSVRYLGGLQRIQYVFVCPERHDIVLVGPGEAWRHDELGNPVGVKTGRTVVQLEDLLAALRFALQPDRHVISCSIDPTPEGIQRMRAYVQTLGRGKASRDADVILRRLEETLGPQTITLGGIDPTTRFAGVLVAADYRMKRLAMGFESSPVKGMPSFADLMGTKRIKNMMPRWWLEDHYDALLTDGEGLAWELRGQGVKVLSEDELVADDGTRKGTGEADPIAQSWANNMTRKYDDLSQRMAIFGRLRNCMDATVVAALIASDRLHEKAGLELGCLIDPELVPLSVASAPQHVASQASYRKKSGHLVITVSGGVQINPWRVAQRREVTNALDGVRKQAVTSGGSTWCWD